MSLFNDASIVQIPSGYKASTLYSIKPSSGAGDFSVVRATTATRVNENGLIESVAANVPRIDYTNGGCGELLVEPQRTNLLTYSEDFSNAAWSKGSAGTGVAPVVTANAGVAPDGNTTADRMQFDRGAGTGGGDSSFIFDAVSGVANEDHAISIYLKSNDANTYDLLFGDSNGIDTTTISVTPEWQRFSIIANNATTIKGVIMAVRGDISVQNVDVLAWGGQLETNAGYVSSYIPTSGSAVTRNADVISLTNASALLGDSAGGIFLEASYFDVQSLGVIGLNDGSAANRTIFGAFTGKIRHILQASSITTVAGNGSLTITPNTFYKIATKYAVNDYASYIDGVSDFTDTTLNTFPDSTLTEVDLSNGAGNDPFYGRIRQLVVFDQALTNAELAAITS